MKPSLRLGVKMVILRKLLSITMLFLQKINTCESASYKILTIAIR